MMKLKIQNVDWQSITDKMHTKCYAIIPNLLSDDECEMLKSEYNNSNAYRKTVVMKRYRFGMGKYKYFNYPMPDLIQQNRTNIYQYLVLIANSWSIGLNRNF